MPQNGGRDPGLREPVLAPDRAPRRGWIASSRQEAAAAGAAALDRALPSLVLRQWRWWRQRNQRPAAEARRAGVAGVADSLRTANAAPKPREPKTGYKEHQHSKIPHTGGKSAQSANHEHACGLGIASMLQYRRLLQ